MRPPDTRIARMRQEHLEEVLRLHVQVLGPISARRLLARLRGRRRPLLLVALHRERVVGYKFGFEDRPGRFYSWIGGVHPDFRRQGIGRALMRCQHRLLAAAGYRSVRTHTRSKHRAMLLLNIATGFDVIGTFTDRRGQPKIILEKRLRRTSSPGAK
ncbi:MAG: GNAT family N-acetyltransferase [Candidatus Eremiobacterota bacterium]